MSNGEFQWSPELQELLARLRERMGFALDYPRGYTPEERQAILNYATRGVEQGERARLESKRKQLAGMGLSGTGFAVPEEERIRRETTQTTAGIRKGFSISEIQNRLKELTATTGMAGDLASRLFSAEQVPEVLSAGRRAEGSRAIDQLLNYFRTVMGGQLGTLNPYLQAILGQAQTTEGAGMDWLPLLSYFMMDEL